MAAWLLRRLPCRGRRHRRRPNPLPCRHWRPKLLDQSGRTAWKLTVAKGRNWPTAAKRRTLPSESWSEAVFDARRSATRRRAAGPCLSWKGQDRPFWTLATVCF